MKLRFGKMKLTAMPMTVAILGIVFIVFWFGTIFLTNSPPLNTTGEATGDIRVDNPKPTKLSFTVHDLLNASNTPAGSVQLYDPDEPGTLLESISLSSGAGTSTNPYNEGRELFAKYVASSRTTHFDYGEVFHVPIHSYTGTVPTLEGASIGVYAMGDVTDNSTNYDIRIQKDSTTKWDTYVTLGAATDAFDPQNDDGSLISIICSNEDAETVYADPRSWTDYAEKVPERQHKAAYLIVNFDLSGSTNVHTKVSDYGLEFYDKGTAEWLEFGGDMALIVPLNSETKCGMYDTEGGKIYLSRNGVDTMFEGTLDFSTMSSVDYSDEIDIEVSIVNDYSLPQAKATNSVGYETFNAAGAAYAFGELSSAWSYDISIG